MNGSCGGGLLGEGAQKIRSRMIMRSEQSGDEVWKRRFVGSWMGDASKRVEVDETSNPVVDIGASTALDGWAHNLKSFVGVVVVG